MPRGEDAREEGRERTASWAWWEGVRMACFAVRLFLFHWLHPGEGRVDEMAQQQALARGMEVAVEHTGRSRRQTARKHPCSHHQELELLGSYDESHRRRRARLAKLSTLVHDPRNSSFEIVVAIIVVANIILLACYYFPSPKLEVQEIGNLVFVLLFALEMALRVLALGPAQYLRLAFG